MCGLDLYRVQSTYTTEYGYTYILCRAAEITIDQISREIQRGELWWIQVPNVWVQGWVWAWLDLVMSQSRRLKFEQLDKWMAGPRHCAVEMGRCPDMVIRSNHLLPWKYSSDQVFQHSSR